MGVNAMAETFELVTVLDQPALFTSSRIDRTTVPAELYVYEVRYDDDNCGCPCEIAPNILVNHLGTIITKEPIEMNGGPDGNSRILTVYEEPLDDDEKISFDDQDFILVCEDFDYSPGGDWSIDEFIKMTKEEFRSLIDEIRNNDSVEC